MFSVVVITIFTQTKQLIMDYKRLTNIKVDGIDTNDYPDFCDAFICYAEYDGVELTDEQYNQLNDDSDFVYSQVEKELY